MCYGSVTLDRRDVFLAIVLTMLVLVAGSYRMVVGVCGTYHDDGIYVSTAKALAEDQGYRLINVPGTPLQTKYPILYPAMLAVVWKLWPVFPENMLAMQGLSLLAGALTVGLSYLYLVRFGYCPRGVAAASGLLCATAPSLLYFSTLTLSEMPFALLLVLAFWTLDSYIDGPSGDRNSQLVVGLVAGVILALPFLCRTIGGVLVPAGLIAMYRAGRPVRWVALGSVIVIVPWVLWMLRGGTWHGDSVTGYYTDYLGWWASSGLKLLGNVFFFNALGVFLGSAGLGLEGFNEAVLSLKISTWPLFVFLGLLPWRMLFIQLRQHRGLSWCLLAYILVVCCWPWPPSRFLIPILPFLIPYLLHALSTMLRRMFPLPGYRVFITVGLGTIVLVNMVSLYRDHQIIHHTGYPYRGSPDAPVSWSSYEGVFSWLRTHSRPEDVVASGLDTMVYLYTGRRAFRPFVHRPMALFYGQKSPAVGTDEELLRNLKSHQARYLVHFPMLDFREEKAYSELLDQLRSTSPPAWFIPVYKGEDQRFVIFELQLQ